MSVDDAAAHIVEAKFWWVLSSVCVKTTRRLFPDSYFPSRAGVPHREVGKPHLSCTGTGNAVGADPSVARILLVGTVGQARRESSSPTFTTWTSLTLRKFLPTRRVGRFPSAWRQGVCCRREVSTSR